MADDQSHFPDLCLQLLLRLSFRPQLLQVLTRSTNARLKLVLVNQPVTVSVYQLADLSLYPAGQHLSFTLIWAGVLRVAQAQTALVFLFDAVRFAQQR
ncbi:MAG: hypothetical protein KA354_24340 [Phycisphaerae bacterium]|nr:hypothetical protein [Phycisphaerae bacterium]